MRSQLDYGLTIYGAAKSSYFQGAKVIQNQGLRICLGAFKSSPVDSLHVEARELPLRLRHEKLLLQYALRISGNTANPAAGHLNQLDEREKYARKTDYIPPFNIRVAKLLQECNLSLESICKLQPPSVPPWKMHKPDIDMSLTVMKKGETADITYQAAFKEMRDAHRDHHTIFTDGSHMNNRTASAAVHGNHIFSERLPDKASIYTAEVNALYLAQDHVETCDETKHLILSDSKSSLEAMRSRTWTHALVNKVLERHHSLTDQGKVIKYGWIPGHAGIRGNDLADTAAKDATNKVELPFALPSPDYRRETNTFINKKWQSKWDNTQTNRLKSIQPKINKAKKPRTYCRRDEIIMSRL